MALLLQVFLKRNTKFQSYNRLISGLNLWNEEVTSEIKHKIESHWNARLGSTSYTENADKQEKYYVLSMFPYPSGNLHMGHVRVYTISDSIARFQRLQSKNVFHPIGWDAFGLPAENAAIEKQLPPRQWTEYNIAEMKKQLNKLGCSFDWNRELSTCDPSYYKWTQELFLKLHKNGLAYQKEAIVNWDPIDQTVLADEQVDENGCSWRSGAKVEKKVLRQWFIRTTQFAKALLDGLNDPILYDWRDIIKLQKHWIGECDGVRFDFKTSGKDVLSVWTSTPEYIENVKFIAISNEHILKRKESLNGEMTAKLNLSALNPFNGEEIPIFVTNEVEFLPFSDCHVGIPGLNEMDADFATKHGITFKTVQVYSNEEAQKKQNEICEKAKNQRIGGYWTSVKLRDWLISRQRYWGTPIPIIHCKKCGPQPVPSEQLPVELPNITTFSQKGGSILADIADWINTSCPNCKGDAKRETDTMDTFFDSSWYYLRYLNPKNSTEMFNVKQASQLTPVDLYIGGKEHATLHLYYARFISHFLFSLGLLPEREPFKRLLVQGMVMGRSFRIKKSGKYVKEEDVNVLDLKRNKAELKSTKEPVVMSWEKMSKSKNNGVDPNDMFSEYGTDTTRLLILADVAPTSHRNWNKNTFSGILNWQKRLWLTIKDFQKHRTTMPSLLPTNEMENHEKYMLDSRNYYVKGVTFNFLFTQQLSIAISKQQGLTNSLRKMPAAVTAHSVQYQRALAAQIIMLTPAAPHFASELWAGFCSAPNTLPNSDEWNWDKSLLEQNWPRIDDDYKVDLVGKVNGNELTTVKIPKKDLNVLSHDKALQLIFGDENIVNAIGKRKVLDTNFQLYKDCEGVVNIVTEVYKPMPNVEVEVQQ